MLFTSDYSVENSVDGDGKCRTLVEARIESGSGFEIYRNKFSIPAVDKNGKMLFQIDIEKKGEQFALILSSAKECLFETGTPATLNLIDGSVLHLNIKLTKDKQVLLPLSLRDTDLLASNRLLSIEMSCKKTNYDVLLKGNQAKLLHDVISCMKS